MGNFLSHDKLPLYYESLTASDANAVIVIVHGLGEHIGRYRQVFADFAHRGYSCYGYDQRGFGQSPGERGHVTTFSQYVDDLEVFINWVSAETQGLPLYLFGHSMGSIVTLSYAINHQSRIDGLLIFSCPLRQAQWLGRNLSPLLGQLSMFFPRFRLSNRLNPEDLTNDPAVIYAFNHDCLVEKMVTLNWLNEFNHACHYLRANAERIKIPAFLVHGACDRIADVVGAVCLFQHLGSVGKMLLLYDGLKHELLNHAESDRLEVVKDTIQWLNTQLNTHTT